VNKWPRLAAKRGMAFPGCLANGSASSCPAIAGCSIRPRASGGGGPRVARWRGRRTQRAARVFVISGHVRSLASSCEENLPQRKRSSKSSAPSTTVRSLRELQWSPSPASRGRKEPAFSQRDLRRSFIHGEARIERKPLRYPPLATCFSLPSAKRGGRTPTDAEPTAASSDAARAQRSAHACRRSTAALA
jgi:hypothetical protein